VAPDVTAREVMNRLRREGWSERAGKGSHVIFSKPGQRNVSVPRHPGDLKPGVLRSIARAAGWEWPPQR
jgi:predicted RNA binding protein YcfA (HicA-like mRNA interferase family)